MSPGITPDAPRIFTPGYYERLRRLEEASWWNAGMRDVASQFLEMAALAPRGVMLDVGCGAGRTLHWFASRYPGWHTVGLDVAAEGLRSTRALGARDVLYASALQLPVVSGSADLVVTLDVLQHLPLDGGDSRALVEIARVLKPGGHLLLRTNAQSIVRAPDDPAFQFHKYHPGELRARLTRAGLQILCLGRLNAVLGLAELPGDFERRGSASYRGLPPAPPRGTSGWADAAKRAWLRMEGRAVRAGWSWPLGRTIMALCRRPIP